tara:strand:- start:550 stop:813 length:264 start_codon:yes stop_codon:yes gene_type:complete
LGETASVRGNAFPKKSVVGVPAAVVPNGLPESFGDGGKIPDEGVDVQGCEGFVAFERRVKVVYVSLMMFPMMDFHGSTVEVGFEGIG